MCRPAVPVGAAGLRIPEEISLSAPTPNAAIISKDEAYAQMRQGGFSLLPSAIDMQQTTP
jgi:hypothetical protein